jgi:hypothetical protein
LAFGKPVILRRPAGGVNGQKTTGQKTAIIFSRIF